MQAYYAHELVDKKEFWMVYCSHVQTFNHGQYGPFLTKTSAEEFLEKYITPDPKSYTGKIVHKIIIDAPPDEAEAVSERGVPRRGPYG